MSQSDLPEMNQPKPRRLTPGQLRYLAAKRKWTRIRLNAWKTMPEKMEAIRREATKQAARRKDEKNDLIRKAMACWPADFDTATLREYIMKDFDYQGRVESLIWRMRRNCMMEFRTDGRWHNLCHLPAPTSLTDSPDNR